MLDTEKFRNQWEEAFKWHRAAQRPGAELDWFGVDSAGELACFITSGFALVPKLVFRDKEMLWNIYNYFYVEPEDYSSLIKTSSLMDYDINLYASKGLYSYDNPSDINKPYELIKTTEFPVHISDLPEEIREWLEPLTFSDFEFSLTKIIDVSRYFECI
jgi:hypothetical protein